MSEMYELRLEKVTWREDHTDEWASGWSIEEYDSDSRYVRVVSFGDEPFVKSLDEAVTGVLRIAMDDYANEVVVVLPPNTTKYRLILPKVVDHAR